MKEPIGALIISRNAIIKAAKIVGSEKILAERIRVSRQILNYWKHNTLLPYDKAIEICLVTRGEVSIYELRPDFKNKMKEFMLMMSKTTQTHEQKISNFG
jgi:DNA-binding transcriptional regulator YdaS (Cro superfamily)